VQLLNSVRQLEDRPRVPRLASCEYTLQVCWTTRYVRLCWVSCTG